MKNLYKLLLGLTVGLFFGILVSLIIPDSNSEVKNVSVFTDTLVLDNQGEIDLYAVDGGRWLVISLDDLSYMVKKRKNGKATIANLESLFERFEIPEKVPVKPVFK